MARGSRAGSAHSLHRVEREGAGDGRREHAAIAELRADAAEFRSTMESMIAARLAQLRQPADGKEGPRGEASPPGKIEGVRPYVEDMVHCEGDIVVREARPIRLGATPAEASHRNGTAARPQRRSRQYNELLPESANCGSS